MSFLRITNDSSVPTFETLQFFHQIFVYFLTLLHCTKQRLPTMKEEKEKVWKEEKEKIPESNQRKQNRTINVKLTLEKDIKLIKNQLKTDYEK